MAPSEDYDPAKETVEPPADDETTDTEAEVTPDSDAPSEPDAPDTDAPQ